MQVRIFKRPKTAMQSGRGNTKHWVMEFEPTAARSVEPLMGWVASPDTNQQVRLTFESKEEAVALAKKRGYMYSVDEPQERVVRPKSYAENFSNRRLARWTH